VNGTARPERLRAEAGVLGEWGGREEMVSSVQCCRFESSYGQAI